MSSPRRSVILAGMPGSGKSSVGRILAGWLGVRFLDMDEEIKRRGGRSPAAIFREDGEIFFRKMERSLVRELRCSAPQVVATGGGTLMVLQNRRDLEHAGDLVGLFAPVKVLAARLCKGRRSRPLLQGTSLEAALRRLWRERRRIYDSIQPSVCTAGLTPEEAAVRVLFSLSLRRR